VRDSLCASKNDSLLGESGFQLGDENSFLLNPLLRRFLFPFLFSKLLSLRRPVLPERVGRSFLSNRRFSGCIPKLLS